MSALTANCKY